MTTAIQSAKIQDKKITPDLKSKVDRKALRELSAKKEDVTLKAAKDGDRVAKPKTSIDKGYKDFSPDLPDVATGTKIPGGISSINKGMHGKVPLEAQGQLNEINEGYLAEAKKKLSAASGDAYADPNKAAAMKKQAEADVKRAGFKPLTEDGFFGAKSKEAVTKFQEDYNKRFTDKSKHLEVDGKIGQSTWKAMQAERARLKGETKDPATSNDGHAHDRIIADKKAKTPDEGAKVKVSDDATKVNSKLTGPGTPAYASAVKANEAMKQGANYMFGTDETKLSKAIIGQSGTPQDMAALKTAYKAKYGRDLPKEVAGETSGRYNGFLQTLMKGERDTSGVVNNKTVEAQASQLRGAIHRNRSNKLNLTKVFAQSSPAHLRALETQYNATHPRSLQAELSRAASGLSADYYNALSAQLDAVRK